MERPAEDVAKISPSAVEIPRLSVLIIDHEEHVRGFLRSMLADLGAGEIWASGDGKTALELYATHRPDAVILDVNLPHMSGVEMLRRLITQDPEAAVIIYTSDRTAQVIKEVSNLGAIAYVLKHLPFAKVQEILAGSLAQIEPRPRVPR